MRNLLTKETCIQGTSIYKAQLYTRGFLMQATLWNALINAEKGFRYHTVNEHVYTKAD